MQPVIPQLAAFHDAALLLLRLVVAAIFFYSGYAHVTKPEERAESIGMSVGFTLLLGWLEMAGALGVAVGVLTQLAAIGLILIMLGAIKKKMADWDTGFWGEKASGWHYDLMLIVMNLVIATSAGGRYVLY
ncbi:MAG: DoxX family protein [Gemmatimonadaceae bacterium]